VSRTVLYLDDTLKMLRETFCVAQTAIGQLGDPRRDDPQDRAERNADIDRLERVIAEIDRQRPLGPDGVHGDRHTDTCGCEDGPRDGMLMNPTGQEASDG